MGRGLFYVICLLQREGLGKKENRKKVRETAQRTGKLRTTKKRREGRKDLRKPQCWGRGRDPRRAAGREMNMKEYWQRTK